MVYAIEIIGPRPKNWELAVMWTYCLDWRHVIEDSELHIEYYDVSGDWKGLIDFEKAINAGSGDEMTEYIADHDMEKIIGDIKLFKEPQTEFTGLSILLQWLIDNLEGNALMENLTRTFRWFDYGITLEELEQIWGKLTYHETKSNIVKQYIDEGREE